MAMKPCDECGKEISDRAAMCPHCGYQYRSLYPGWEYKSEANFFGLPWVHIASGVDPGTGRPRIARGVLAIGNIAVGLVAFGGVAFGGLTFGGLSLGLIALGGMAVGLLLGVGGCAVGLCAIGGCAIGWSLFAFPVAFKATAAAHGCVRLHRHSLGL